MDSEMQEKEDSVTDPMKHLLSLDWESTRISSKSKNPDLDIEQLKPKKKKVRFSDEVEEIICDTNYFIESSSEISDATMLIEENKNYVSSDTVNLKEDNALTETPSSEINVTGDETVLQKRDGGFQDVSDVDGSAEISIGDLTSKIKKCSLHLPQSNNTSENVPSSSHINSLFLQTYNEVGSDSSLAQAKNVLNIEENWNKGLQQKVCNKKPSMELHSVLAKDANISSASELKTSVFKAWHKVKKKSKAIESSTSEKFSTKPDNETLISIISKEPSVSTPKAYKLRPKSKNKYLKREANKKSKNKINELTENKKSDKEEQEIAFKMWKKRKDEILKQRLVSEKIKEEEHNAILLMNANQKKKEAEAAFSAWETHKFHMMEIEKKKKVWLEHREKEKRVTETLRDQESLKMYELWLETKHFPYEKNCFDSCKTKPPWIPPGKPSI